jgi:hypothetical protein
MPRVAQAALSNEADLKRMELLHSPVEDETIASARRTHTLRCSMNDLSFNNFRRASRRGVVIIAVGLVGCSSEPPPTAPQQPYVGVGQPGVMAPQPMPPLDKASAAECTALVDDLNEAVGKVAILTTSEAPVDQQLIAVSQSMDAAAKRAALLPMTDSVLIGLRARYVAMANKSATAAAALAVAAREKDKVNGPRLQKEFELALAEEDGIVDGINARCQ